MNDRLTYESIIAAKLEQLSPLPAMADAIWSRISADLDLEMPQDHENGSDNGGPGGATGGAGAFLWPGFALMLAVLAGIVYWNKPGLPAATKAPAAKVDSGTMDQPAATKAKELDKDRGNAIQYPGTQISTEPGAAPDSIEAEKSTPAYLTPDTMATAESSQAEEFKPLAPKKEDMPAPIIKQSDTPLIGSKKPRGVQGINSTDYRIVPGKKDTTKKN